MIYQFSCCCKVSNIGLTTRHLRKRLKEHDLKSAENFYYSEKKDDIPLNIKVQNVSKGSSIAEHTQNVQIVIILINLKNIKNVLMFSIKLN